jgi:ribulose-5-phosphate 4-epimerase/fuculose-1-phosphate aldolase
MSDQVDKLKEQIVDCTRMLLMQDILDYSGHVSARIPGTDRLLIQPRDTSRAALRPKDILVVDMDGRIVEGEGPAPSETALHRWVYRTRSDTMAVCHGHPPMTTLFTVAEQPWAAARNYAYRFIGIPTHADTTHIRSDEQGQALAHTLGAHRACLLRAHGTVVVASTVAELFMDCLELEENARSLYRAATLGALRPITPDEAEQLKASYGKQDARPAKIWEHYQQKARAAGTLT